jgi:hypothetical protein
MDFFGYGKSVLRNRFLWELGEWNIGIGYFYNFEALGLDILFKWEGVNLRLPFFYHFLDNELEEIKCKTPVLSFMEMIFYILLSTGISNLFKYGILYLNKHSSKGIMKFIEEEKLKEKKEILRILQLNHFKCEEKLHFYADRKHKAELEKKEKGLIIHIALYGNFEILHKYKKEIDNFIYKKEYSKRKNLDINYLEFDLSLFIKKLMIKMKELCLDIENEVIDCTITLRSRITEKDNYFHSIVLINEKDKSKMFGLYNPIFKSEDQDQIKSIFVM